MSDELIGLVRETLAETRELRIEVLKSAAQVERLQTEMDARLDEMRRIVTVELEAPTDRGRSWPDVVTEVLKEKLVQYAIIIVAMGLAGVSAAELRSAILGGNVQLEVDDEMPLDDDDETNG